MHLFIFVQVLNYSCSGLLLGVFPGTSGLAGRLKIGRGRGLFGGTGSSGTPSGIFTGLPSSGRVCCWVLFFKFSISCSRGLAAGKFSGKGSVDGGTVGEPGRFITGRGRGNLGASGVAVGSGLVSGAGSGVVATAFCSGLAGLGRLNTGRGRGRLGTSATVGSGLL
jgi:hypothetical protein